MAAADNSGKVPGVISFGFTVQGTRVRFRLISVLPPIVLSLVIGYTFGPRDDVQPSLALVLSLVAVVLVCLGSLILHELAHVVVGRWLAVPVRSVQYGIVGDRIDIDRGKGGAARWSLCCWLGPWPAWAWLA